MKRIMRTLLFAALCLVMLAAVLPGASAASEGSCGVGVTWTYDAELMQLNIVGAATEEKNTGTLTATSDWSELADKVKTVWISGDVYKISNGAFNYFTGLECVVIDCPELASVGTSAMSSCRQLKRLYAVGDASIEDWYYDLKLPAGEKRLVAGTDKLFLIRFDEPEEGRFVSDAAPYHADGDVIRVAVLPEPGYRLSYINADGASAAGNCGYTVHGSCLFTAELWADTGVELLNETSFGSAGQYMNWYLYRDRYQGGDTTDTGYTIEFVGFGDMAKQSSATRYGWNSFGANIDEVLIPEGVTGLSQYAFKLPKLERISIPSTVDFLGANVFSACPELYCAEFAGRRPGVVEGNIFPTSLVGAFEAVYSSSYSGSWSDGLTDAAGITYPTVCSDGAAEDFTALTKLDGDTYVNSQGIIFTLDASTKTATVGVNVINGRNTSGYNGMAAADPSGIVTVGLAVIPDMVEFGGQEYAVTGIAMNAFSDNRVLTKLQLGGRVRDVATGAFYDCPHFTDFIVGESDSFMELDGILYDVSMGTLRVCPGGKEFYSYEIPSAVHDIAVGAFWGCRRITEVVFELGVETIRDDAFHGAVGLERVEINHDVRRIGDRVFSGCTGLREAYIYNGVEYMGVYPFEGCSSLSSLELPFMGKDSATPSTLPSLFNMSAKNVPLVNLRLFGGSLAASAFRGCPNLRTVGFPYSIIELPSACFDGCVSLNTVAFGKDVSDCKPGEIEIPTWIRAFGKNAFRGCASVERFTANEYSSFFSTDFWGALYTKNFKELITYPAAAPFQYYCVKGSADSVQDYAFYNCFKLVTVNFPSADTKMTYRVAYPNRQETGVDYNFKPCVHRGSEAEKALGVTSDIWTFEGEYPQSIRIQRMPDHVAFEEGAEKEYSNLYFVAVYPGVTILLDEMDYTLKAGVANKSGGAIVTASYRLPGEDGEYPMTTFRTQTVSKLDNYTILEYNIPSSAAKYDAFRDFAALYGFDGRMTELAKTYRINNVEAANDLRVAVYAPTELVSGERSELGIFTTVSYGDKLYMPVCPATREHWLPRPVQLRWGTVLTADGEVSRPGQISWNASPAEDENFYHLTVYRIGSEGNDAAVESFSLRGWGFDGRVNYRDFLRRINNYGSGSYYFTVTSECVHTDALHRTSAEARSGVFSYVEPGKTLSPFTDPRWVNEDGRQKMVWDEPEEGMDGVGGYTVTLYYRRWIKGAWRKVSETVNFYDVDTLGGALDMDAYEWLFGANKYRAGYYAFTVTAESADITAQNRSTESPMCEVPYYYPGK